jgi:hypothetical protein
MLRHPAPSPAGRGRKGEGACVQGSTATRRRLFAAAFAFLATAFPLRSSRAGPADELRRILPPGLDPAAIGAALRASYPTCSRGECRTRAALADLANLPARAAADFAAGHTVIVEGWILSRTEAWLCATLA